MEIKVANMVTMGTCHHLFNSLIDREDQDIGDGGGSLRHAAAKTNVLHWEDTQPVRKPFHATCRRVDWVVDYNGLKLTN